MGYVRAVRRGKMLIFERVMGGGLGRYARVFLPSPDELATLACQIGGFDVIRVFFGPTGFPEGFPPIAQGWAQTTVVDLTKGQDAIYAGMHTNCRYKIRRAEKMHDRFEIAMNTEAARTDFLALYNVFAVKKKIPLLKRRRFGEYLPHADVFTLYFEGRPACGRLVLRDEDSCKALMLYSGTCRFDEGTDTITVGLLNRYLHWHEMKTYQAAGMETYDFGGVGPVNAPVDNFKMSFGGQVVTFGLYFYAGSARPLWRLAFSLYEMGRRIAAVHSMGGGSRQISAGPVSLRRVNAPTRGPFERDGTAAEYLMRYLPR
jgi:hypothetical protein